MHSLIELLRRPFRTLSVFAAVLALASVGLVLAPVVTAAPVQQPAAERASWQMLPLTDARTGQPFTLADFAGKTVYVEPMATWCTNCRQQLNVIRDQVRGQVDPEQVVFVSLSVETTLTPETLATYTTTHGYDWTFAVMSQELLQELAAQYGRTVTNPPAVPHFLIMPDGSTTDLSTGHHSAEKLLEKLSIGSMMDPMKPADGMDPMKP
jgi:cytochrome oxidase Cu insertion factor (SCO1/SenC/PrrC family)